MYIETVEKFAAVGQHKVDMIKNHLPAFFVGAMMAGAYIGFGDIIMFTAGAHVDPSWNHLVMGVVFASALTIVIFAGSELFTGTAMYMAFALFKRTACQSAQNIHPIYLSNFHPPVDDQRLACPALAGVAEGRPSAGDGCLRL